MANRRKSRELLMRLVYQMSVTGDWSDEEVAGFLAENAGQEAGGGDGRESGRGGSGRRKSGGDHDVRGGGGRESGGSGLGDGAGVYFDTVMAAVRSNIKDIDSAIGKASDNWRIGRIAKVDLAIIRLAAAEIAYVPGIPVAVSVNEAVDLAKRYGSDKSYEFVNGVLGRIVRDSAAVVEHTAPAAPAASAEHTAPAEPAASAESVAEAEPAAVAAPAGPAADKGGID
jgi:N utilization substance protein B